MFVAWKVRPIVCLLLAVVTALGAVVPARACACTTSAARTPPTSDRTAKPAAKSCCQPAKKHSCCSPGSTCGTAKVSCCGEPVRTEPADPSGCPCVRCDCGAPAAPA